MEKISGILPATSRITSVDLKSGPAARSGGPSFGRPQGLSTVAQRQADIEARQLAVVDQLANDFFVKTGRPVTAEAPVEIDPSEKYGVDADLNPLTARIDDLDQPEIGAYLDVTA